jgi:hypothetical protein
MTTDFFNNSNGKVGTMSAAPSGTWAAAGTSNQCTLSSRARPLWRGQIVTIVDNGAETIVTSTGEPCRFMVTQVNSFTGTAGTSKCQLESIDAPATTYTGASPDTLHLWGANTTTSSNETNYGIEGLGDHILNPSDSATVTLHGLQIQTSASATSYPELLSYVDVPGTDRWPTPSVFEKAMDEIHDRGFMAPDRWVVSRGIRTLFYQTEGLYKTYNTDLAGPVQRGADGGITGPASITTEKGAAEMVISAFGDRDVAYGIRPDAFVHYAPGGMDAIQFVGDSPLLGNSMFLVARSSDNVTPIYEAPYDFYIERGCLAPQSLAKVGSLKYHSEVSA